MSRERELLESVVEYWGIQAYPHDWEKLVREIRAYLAQPTQDEEPFGYVEFIEDAGLNFCTLQPTGDYPYQPIYLHPAPRPEFVRLSEEEISEIEARIPPKMDLAEAKKKFARAVEDALAEKNRG